MRLAPILVLVTVVGGLLAFARYDRTWWPVVFAAVVVVVALTFFRGAFTRRGFK